MSADPTGPAKIDRMRLRSIEGRAQGAVFVLGATIAVSVVAIGVDLWEISVIDAYLDGTADIAALESSDARQAGVGVATFSVLVATAVLFLRWFSAAYKNLDELGAEGLRFTHGWAVGAWFVPILNLVRPKRIADDIWRGSDPAMPRAPGVDWRYGATTGLVTFWWALWLVSNFVGAGAGRVFFDADTLEDSRNATIFDIVSVGIDIAAAVLAIVVVRRLTTRQVERARRLAEEVRPLAQPQLFDPATC